jgi:hypothetical protein
MIASVVADVAPWLALVGALGAAVAIFHSTQVKSSLDVITAANEELRAVINDEKREREDDRRRCDGQLAEMRGQLQTLTGEFGKQIAQSIVEEWRKIEQPSVTTTTVQHTTTTKGTKP